MVAVGQYTRGSLTRFLVADDDDRGRNTRTSTRGDRGNSRANAYRHRTSYPGGGASKTIMAAAFPIFRRPRVAKSQENRPNAPKHEYSLKSSIASSPSLFRERRFEAPSANPRDPGCDGFLVWPAKRKERLAAAPTRRRKPSLLSNLVGVRQQGTV